MADEQPPPQQQVPSTLQMFMKNTKESVEILKNNHNKMADKLNDTIKEINEIKEFLTFNNKRYRKFYHKKHLKNKFK